jgi:hypothetical protein
VDRALELGINHIETATVSTIVYNADDKHTTVCHFYFSSGYCYCPLSTYLYLAFCNVYMLVQLRSSAKLALCSHVLSAQYIYYDRTLFGINLYRVMVVLSMYFAHILLLNLYTHVS